MDTLGEPTQDASTDITPPESNPVVEETSAEYLGRWNRLVSTTNWQKGRIICEWRAELIDAGAPPAAGTDEAWSHRVGNVTPQHVGRLRRVYQQFGGVYEQYAGLYWSHFQAALDWPDAEMWLEGAVQNHWSVAQMRSQRWEATGAPAELKPRDEDIVAAELDEGADRPSPETVSSTVAEVQPDGAPPDNETEATFHEAEPLLDEFLSGAPAAEPPLEPVRPFANLAELPADLSEAFESFKLAILHHKLAGWKEIHADEVVAALEALEQLALSPVED